MSAVALYCKSSEMTVSCMEMKRTHVKEIQEVCWERIFTGNRRDDNEKRGEKQKVKKFDPTQFSADSEVGASGQGHMAWPYVPAGSGFAQVQYIPHKSQL